MDLNEIQIDNGTWRVTGVPGAGKTTFLTRQVKKAIESHGPGNVVITSFTKTAAEEIAGRGLELDPHQIGTLHSIAYRALGCPKLVETTANIKEWNEHIKLKKSYLQLSLNNEPDIDDLGAEKKPQSEGDNYSQQYNIYRNKLTSKDHWPLIVQDFAKEWEAWKKEVGGIDFTDMIELALKDIERIPWNPAVGFLDEANDSSRLMLALWNKWSKHMDFNIICGDADQVLYHWAGVDVGAFLDLPVPEENKRYLVDSFRCPIKVTDLANKTIQRCMTRDPVTMKPRADEGEIRRLSATTREPELAIKDAEQYLKQGKKVAFLTTCSYMLSNIIAVLRKLALPYENKYRRRRGDWNPLFCGTGKTSASSRVLAYLAPIVNPLVEGDLWTPDQLQRWIEDIQADGVLSRGAKKSIQDFYGERIPYKNLKDWFSPCWSDPAGIDINWFFQHLLPKRKRVYEYPISIAKQHGPEKLKEEPLITIGTIHSVKGATFDVVYLFPDLSPQGFANWWAGGDDRDAVLRCWYVGITRSRESVILCSPSNNMAIE